MTLERWVKSISWKFGDAENIDLFILGFLNLGDRRGSMLKCSDSDDLHGMESPIVGKLHNYILQEHQSIITVMSLMI